MTPKQHLDKPKSYNKYWGKNTLCNVFIKMLLTKNIYYNQKN
jgi:hypothetical protein